MLKIENIHKTFGKNKVLKGVNLQVKPGKITAILGPNASGKTTLIKSVLGLVVPDEGDIFWNDAKVQTNKHYEYRQQIGYLSQIARFPENLKVNELIAMLNDIRGDKGNPEPLIEYFDLRSSMNTKLSRLSGGTRQKVNILVSLMFESSFLILDEPTVGLDPVALIRLKDLIKKEKEKGKTILLTTHIMNLVEEMADEIVFLLEGEIYFQGSLEEMKASQQEDDLERAIAAILMNNGYQNRASLINEE